MKKEPDGKILLSTLVDLLADQNNVKITYEIEQRSNNNEKTEIQG